MKCDIMFACLRFSSFYYMQIIKCTIKFSIPRALERSMVSVRFDFMVSVELYSNYTYHDSNNSHKS